MRQRQPPGAWQEIPLLWCCYCYGAVATATATAMVLLLLLLPLLRLLASELVWAPAMLLHHLQLPLVQTPVSASSVAATFAYIKRRALLMLPPLHPCSPSTLLLFAPNPHCHCCVQSRIAAIMEHLRALLWRLPLPLLLQYCCLFQEASSVGMVAHLRPSPSPLCAALSPPLRAQYTFCFDTYASPHPPLHSHKPLPTHEL